MPRNHVVYSDEALDSLIARKAALIERHRRENAFRLFKPLEYQKEWFKSRKKIRCLFCGNQVGKCLGKNSLVYLAGGDRVRAGDLVGRTFELPALSEDGRVVSRPARADWNRIEPVYRLVTERGWHELEANAEHPVWAARVERRSGRTPVVSEAGFTPLSEIRPGMLVALADEFSVFGDERASDAEIEMLALMIGDGSKADVQFTQGPGRVADRYCEVVEALGDAVSSYPQPGKTMTYGARGGAVRALMRGTGLGTNSKTAFVPDRVFAASRRQVALFLNRLFACDGWAMVRRNQTVEIGYSSISKRLIEDVNHLLVRFGIHGKLRERKLLVSGRDYLVYEWVTHEARHAQRFIAEIGILGKEDALAKVGAAAQRLLGVKERKWLTRGAPAGLRWDVVASVEKVGTDMTVAIEVPEGNTFLSPIYQHNTEFLAVTMISACLGCYPPGVSGKDLPSAFPALQVGPKRFLIVGESYSTTIPEAIVPKLMKYISPEMLRAKPKKLSTGIPILFQFKSGAELHIMSQEQGSAGFEGAVHHGVGFDEPPREDIFNSVRRGTMATQGWIVIAGTPLKESWMRDVIEAAQNNPQDPNYGLVDVFRVPIWKNCVHDGGFLPHNEIEAYLNSLPPKERAARENGEFADYSGVEFPYVSPDSHLVPDFF